MTKPVQPALFDAPAQPKRRPRSEAQRAAFEAQRPMTDIERSYPEAHRLDDVYPVDALLYDARLGLILVYEYTFVGQDSGAHIMARVCECTGGVRCRVGSVLARPASELRRVIRCANS
jgi:hypothetical protein